MDDQEAESRQGFLSDAHKTFRYDEKQERWVLPWTFSVGYPKFSTIQRQFTGGLKYDETGELFLNGGEESKRYIGNSSSVDEAWNEFDAVQNIELDPGEVSVKGLYIDGRNKAITIPDVFHQLHCLNQIRIALYDPQYLTNENTKRRLHVGEFRKVPICDITLTIRS
ncbi:hypothetical protein SLS60_005402 [Paraconiothyrium brasiliense]|uniref:Uncharacterized protein n=1 Tax=Paraconiothyrium brasiliense TaxID=300254 RepID=A0ABR3RHB2_9PLEO